MVEPYLRNDYLRFTVFLIVLIITVSGIFVNADVADDNYHGGSELDISDRPDGETLLRLLLIEGGFYDKKRQRLLAERNTTLNVSLSMSVRNIIDIDERSGVVSIGAHMGMKWYDFRLKWKLSLINLSSFPVRPQDINPPDVVLLNSYDLRELRPFSPNMAVLHNDGKVLWFPLGVLRVGCAVDAKYWPYTMLECDYKFGVPSHPDQEVRLYLHSRHISIDDFFETKKWKIVKGIKISETGDRSESSNSQKGFFSASLYGEIQPKFRLIFQRKPNRFLSSVFYIPILLLELFGLLFLWISCPRWNYLVTMTGLLTFAGFRVALNCFAPSSTNPERSPIIGTFIADSFYLMVYLLICNFIIELISRQTRVLPGRISWLLRIRSDDLSGSEKEVTIAGWKRAAAVSRLLFWIVYFILVKILFCFTISPYNFADELDTEMEAFYNETAKTYKYVTTHTKY